MQKKDAPVILLLILLGSFIWLRDLAWTASKEDTLPILVAIPLFIWLGAPWNLKKESSPIALKWIIATVSCFVLGILFNLTFILSLGWTALLWGWLSTKINPTRKPEVLKLMLFPLTAFPWISLDITSLGWWLRYSGAVITASFFSFLDYHVVQTGTTVLINGVPLAIEQACAGLNTLQAMLIAGTMVAFLLLKHSYKFWWNLPFLVVMAWISNTLRIIIVSFFAIMVSPEFAMGSFHTWGGAAVLFLMFGLCWLVFSIQEPKFSDIK